MLGKIEGRRRRATEDAMGGCISDTMDVSKLWEVVEDRGA